MRAWRFSSFGLDALQMVDLPLPEPGPGQVRVQVQAVSLNYRDLLLLKGQYNPRLRLPRIPCSDAAGVVDTVGPGVTLWKPGDRVAPIFMQNWIDGPPTPGKTRGALGGDIDGVLTEAVVLQESGLVALPEHLSFEEASTLPCAAVTAWNALHTAPDLRSGGVVLIQGTGGVALFALQLARLRGARVLGISSSDAKLQRAYAMGLDSGLNYRNQPDWDRWVLDETGGRGADLIIETGGLGALPQSLRALRMGGTIAQVGVLSEQQEPFPLTTVIHKQARIQGVYVGSRRDFEELLQAVRLAVLRPVGENFPWTQAPEALARLEEGGHFGKLVLTVG